MLFFVVCCFLRLSARGSPREVLGPCFSFLTVLADGADSDKCSIIILPPNEWVVVAAVLVLEVVAAVLGSQTRVNLEYASKTGSVSRLGHHDPVCGIIQDRDQIIVLVDNY